MAFFIRSASGAPLTFDREQEQFLRAIPTGIFTGMQVYQGTPATYQISLFGGVFCINGIVIYDDQDYTNLFDLGAPGADEHHLIYVTYNPDTDVEPVYSVKVGTYAAPATLDPTEAANGFVIADVWMPSAAANITDAVINNRDEVADLNSVREFVERKSMVSFRRSVVENIGAGVYRLSFDDLQMLTVTPQKGVETSPTQFPFVTTNVISSTPDTFYGGAGYQINYDVSGTTDDDYILFYVRVSDDVTAETTEFINAIGFSSADTNATLESLAELLGDDDGAFAGTGTYPYRPDLKNAFIVAVVNVDHGWVHYANGVSSPVDVNFDSGTSAQYVTTVSAGFWGTGATAPTGGNIDLDDILPNASILYNATLDDVYDSFLVGAPAGSGRQATVDAGAFELDSVVDITPSATSGDQWNAAMRVALDSTATTDAPTEERAFDIYSEEQDSTRLAMSLRRPLYYSGGAELLKDIPITLAVSAGQIVVADYAGSPSLPTVTQYRDLHGFNDVYGQRRVVTFPTFDGGDAQYKAYFLKYDIGGSYFYLETIDGVQDINLTYSTDFNYAGVINTTMTIWEEHVRIGQTSIVQDIEVQGELLSKGGETLRPKLRFDGYTRIQDFIEDNDRLSRGSFSTPALEAAYLNLPWIPTGGAWPITGIDVRIGGGSTYFSSASFPIKTDGRWIAYLEDFINGTPLTVRILNSRDCTGFTQISTNENASNLAGAAIAINGNKLAIGYEASATSQPTIDVWDIEDGTLDWSAVAPGGITGDIENMVIIQSRLHVVTSSTSTDQVYAQFAMFNGSLASDSTAGNLNFARRADDGVDIAAYGDRIGILTDDASGGHLTFIDIAINLQADGLALSTESTSAPFSISMWEDYVAVMKGNGFVGLNTWIYTIKSNTFDFGVATKNVYKTLTHNGGSTGGFRTVRITDKYVVAYYFDLADTSGRLELWDYTGDVSASSQVITEAILGGFDIDHQDIFVMLGSTVWVYSLGRRPGIWFEADNHEGSNLRQPMSRWLALPARGF